MYAEQVILGCNVIAAATALAAALAWYRASRKPVAVQAGTGYGVSARTPGVKKHNDEILAGADLSRKAALLTGVSALAQCASIVLTQWVRY